MTDAEWSRILADLQAIETGDDIERAVKASMRLAELDDSSRLSDLKPLVETAGFFVLEAIATPIANLEGLSALPLLLHALDRGQAQGHDCDTLTHTITELIEQYPQRATPLLIEMLKSIDESTRTHAAWLLGDASAVIDPGPLIGALNDPCPNVRAVAVGSLAVFESRTEVFDAFARMLNDPDEQVRAATVSSLAFVRDQRAIALLESARHDAAKRVREVANFAIERWQQGHE